MTFQKRYETYLAKWPDFLTDILEENRGGNPHKPRDTERLTQWEFLPDDLKELAALWPALSNEDRQYVLGVAEGRAAKGTK